MVHPMLQTVPRLFPDEDPDLFREAEKIWGGDARRWWTTANDLLGGRAPGDLAGTPEEQRVRDLIRSIKYIGVS